MLYTKPTTEVVPASNESGDKQASKVSKQLLDSLKYENRMDEIYQRALLECFTAGEAFLITQWDSSRGAIHPSYKRLKKDPSLKIPLIGSDGKPVKDMSGEPVMIKPPMRVGDVRFVQPRTENVLLPYAPKFDEVPWVIVKTFLHVEKAKKLWEEKAERIEADNSLELFDYQNLDYHHPSDWVTVYHFWHRSDTDLDKGLYCSFTKGLLLDDPRELDINPEHTDGAELGNIPITRITDIDIPGRLRGWSGMHNINHLQSRYDRCLTLTDRNIFLVNHPKWMAPRGSVSVEQLSSDALFVEFHGPVAPQLVTFPAGTQEVFQYSTTLLEQMEKLSKVFSITRGAPPPGTRSASQQLFWQEQQELRSSLFKTKFSNFVVEVDRKTLALCAAKYRNHDDRLIKVMGQDKTWEIRTFDVESLARSFDIRVQASSALPESKYARVETLMNLYQTIPGLFTREQLVDMFGFGQADKYVDMGRAPILCAEQEQEMWQSGDDVPDPEKTDDHISHWNTHYKFMQSMSYRVQDEKTKEEVRTHLGIHEMFLWAIAKDNPTMQKLLLELPQFPLVFVLPQEPAAPAAPLPQAPIPTAGAPMPPEAPMPVTAPLEEEPIISGVPQ
jgi:hypothetical protein